MEEPAHRYPLPLYWLFCSWGLSCHCNKAGAWTYSQPGMDYTASLGGSEYGFDPGSYFLWDHPSWQLRYKPLSLLTACHSTPHYSVSHDLLISPRDVQRGRTRRVDSTRGGFSDKASLSHAPLAGLVSSLAPNEGVFVERGGAGVV